MSTNIKSASRVLDLLELFAAVPTPLGVSEVSRRLAIPKSSAQGLLVTLVGRGYLERAASDYQLATVYRNRNWVGGVYVDLVRLSRPIMETIVAQSGETSFLAIMSESGRVQYIAKVVSSNPVRYDGDLAPARPAYCTSSGLVMLAYRDGAFVERYFLSEPLKKINSSTITDRRLLRALLKEILQKGQAEIVDGHVEGASGVAAPIFDSRGAVIGALHLAAPTTRYLRARSLMRDQVVWGAAEITRMLKGLESLGNGRRAKGVPVRDSTKKIIKNGAQK
jgi:DNA-binding IclR family transcriptional regulator